MALEFDDKTARLLDQSYEGRDFRARRAFNMGLLAPKAGEVIVDIGCGAGHLDEELARAGARVIGIDPSDAMLKTAAARCENHDNVEFRKGSVEALPLEAKSADGAISIQVFEYLDDIPAALAETARVLKPGGRAVIGDMHFGTFIWATDDPVRHKRMCEIWDGHFVTGRAPEQVLESMPGAGFGDISIATETYTDIELRPDGLARMLLILMSSFAASNGEPELGSAWRDEQEQRARDGRFMFSCSHMVLKGIRV